MKTRTHPPPPSPSRLSRQRIIHFIQSRDEQWLRYRTHPWIGRVERSLQALLAVCFGMMVVYKTRSGTQWFLLQPCHADVLSYWVLLMWGEPREPTSHIVFNLLVHHCWGTVMALLQPDLRDYAQPFEVQMFWIEHVVLLATPLLLMATQRYRLLAPSWPMIMASFFGFAAYHSLILAPAAWISGNNLNYLMSPPPGRCLTRSSGGGRGRGLTLTTGRRPIGILEYFGKSYRVVMYCACFLVTVFTRCVLLAGAEKLINQFRDSIPTSPLPARAKSE